MLALNEHNVIVDVDIENTLRRARFFFVAIYVQRAAMFGGCSQSMKARPHGPIHSTHTVSGALNAPQLAQEAPTQHAEGLAWQPSSARHERHSSHHSSPLPHRPSRVRLGQR